MKTGAIIVLYNPDRERLASGIRSMVKQVDRVCLVDNSAQADDGLAGQEKTDYIPLHGNKGIAYAQNIGIAHLLEMGAEYLIFSDQDSVAQPDVVEKLMTAHRALQQNGYAVGAVGTRAINVRSGKPYVELPNEKQHFEGKSVGIAGMITETYSVMSSVSLISAENIRRCGGFDESLFIDGVDNEWGWRAFSRHKLRSFIIEEATITHQLGTGDRRIGGRSVAISSVFRLYYQFRNYIWLCRRSETPAFWKKTNGMKYAVKLVYYPLFVPPRWEYAKAIFRAIRDGISIKNNKASFPTF